MSAAQVSGSSLRGLLSGQRDQPPPEGASALAAAAEDSPPIVFAKMEARAAADRIVPDRILENEVERGLHRGYWRAIRGTQRREVVVGGFSGVAVVKPSVTPAGRQAWLVESVRPGRVKFATLEAART